MRATGTRRTVGIAFLIGAFIAAAVAVYTWLFRDDGPTGSYVALAVTFTGAGVVFLATNAQI